MPVPIVFIDLAERAEEGRTQMNPAPQPPATGDHDPFFVGLREKLARMGVLPAKPQNPPDPLLHVAGKFPSQQGQNPAALTNQEKILAAMYGILERDNLTNPAADRFGESVAKSLGEFSKLQELFFAVLPFIAQAGQLQVPVAGQNETQQHVRTDTWTAVVRTLYEGEITAADPNLALLALGALEDLRNADGGLTPSTIESALIGESCRGRDHSRQPARHAGDLLCRHAGRIESLSSG
jgi:hypothetical protein